jgi:general secretion pathway protein G
MRREVVRDNARQTRRGFTLMEVLVVVAIIVILAGAGAVYLLPRLGEAKEKVAKANIMSLTTATGTYYLNNGQMPPSLADLTAPQPNGGRRLVPPEAILDPWGKPYQYDPSGPRNGGDQADIWTVSPEGHEIGNWTK